MTNLVKETGCPSEHAETLAGELLTLHVSGEPANNPPDRKPKQALQREADPQPPKGVLNPQPQLGPKTRNTLFGETLYAVN